MAKNNLSTIEMLKSEIAELHDKVKKLESRLAMNHGAFLHIIEKSLEGIVILNEKKTVIYTNYAAINLFDRNIADLLGESLDPILDKNSPTEINIPHADGSLSIAEVNIIKTEWNSAPSYLVSFRDITERKKYEEMLAYMSNHDYLTDLPNRVYFEKEIANAIQEAKEKDQYMALLFLDLDNFKIINDTLGHDGGDLVLKEVSHILRQNTRKGDMIARLGGDEFALILSSLRTPEYAATVSKIILDKLSTPFILKGTEISTNVSIGIAIYPLSGMTAVDLIRNADTAMYMAKKSGKNQYQFFSEILNQENKKNLQIINSLRNVLHKEELFLCYQPIINLKTLQCFGVEALLRWQHPNLGLILPDQFLPYVEESGMMSIVGHWVVEHALFDYKKLNVNPLFISINLSTNELEGAKITEMILEHLKELNIKPQNMILELTETSVMRRPEDSIKKLQQLAKTGIQIAIDDYGLGYSSLSYIKQLPVSILKIDQSFIKDIGKNPHDTAIVKSTIQLAHNLGLKIIAEGVETKEQAHFLKEQDCDYVQGYYFAEPMRLEVLKKWLTKKIPEV